MKKLLASLLFTTLVMPLYAREISSLSYSSTRTSSYSAADEETPWKPGEIVERTQEVLFGIGPIPLYTKFLGTSNHGYYVFQKFYSESDQKLSGPIYVVIPEECLIEKCSILKLHDLQITGPFMMWYENGRIWATGNYNQSQEQGLWTVWHENGQIWAQGNYQNAKACGIWLFWDKEGHLIKEEKYEPCHNH